MTRTSPVLSYNLTHMIHSKFSGTVLMRFTGRSGRSRLTEALQRQALFSGNPTLARTVANLAVLRDLSPGETLTIQGGTDSDIYFVLAGTVSIRVNGREVATRGPGDHVGEMAMADSAALRSASVVALDSCTCAKLTELQFTRLASRQPDLWRRVAVTLAARLRERSKFHLVPRTQPAVFIGSSSEGLEIAQSIYQYLRRYPVVPELWSKGVFQASKTAIEDLVKISTESDFAIIVLTPDDLTRSRGVLKSSPRDNALFELGLFMGALGRERTYFVCPRGIDIKIPTDLLGITRLDYRPRGRPSLSRRLLSTKQHIRQLIIKHGPR
jgi:CRP/FNR family cyclic AMP-dependent transcriptional regulator